MADISNAQAIKFANEKVRPLADLISKMYRTLPQFMTDVVEFETIVAGNANGDVILDGSATDGRTPITKLDVAAFKFVVEQLIACMETSDRVAVADKPSVNSTPIF